MKEQIRELEERIRKINLTLGKDIGQNHALNQQVFMNRQLQNWICALNEQIAEQSRQIHKLEVENASLKIEHHATRVKQ